MTNRTGNFAKTVDLKLASGNLIEPCYYLICHDLHSRIGMKPQLVLDEDGKRKRFAKYKQFKSCQSAVPSNVLKKDPSLESADSSDSLTESGESDEEVVPLVDKNKIESELLQHESILDPETGLVSVQDRNSTLEDNNLMKIDASQRDLCEGNSYLSTIKSVTVKQSNNPRSKRKSVIVRRDDLNDQERTNTMVEIELEGQENDYKMKICIDLMEVENLYKKEEKSYFKNLLTQFEGVFKISFGEELMNDYIIFCKEKEISSGRRKSFLPMKFLNCMEASGR